MRGISVFTIALLTFFCASARAQGPAGVGAASQAGGRHSNRTSGGGPERINERVYYPWQVAIGYQYNEDNLLGSPFHTNGVNADVTRYFGRFVGVEGQLGAGFGNTRQTSTPPNLNSQSLFAGGGGHLAYRNRTRFEPWAHVLVGMEHFRFTQTAGVLGSNTALAGTAGGGLDVLLTQHWSFRGEADEVGSHFFSTYQHHFQAVGGFVLNF